MCLSGGGCSFLFYSVPLVLTSLRCVSAMRRPSTSSFRALAWEDLCTSLPIVVTVAKATSGASSCCWLPSSCWTSEWRCLSFAGHFRHLIGFSFVPAGVQRFFQCVDWLSESSTAGHLWTRFQYGGQEHWVSSGCVGFTPEGGSGQPAFTLN